MGPFFGCRYYHSGLPQGNSVAFVVRVLGVRVDAADVVLHHVVKLDGENVFDVFLQPIEMHSTAGLFHYVDAWWVEHSFSI